MKEYIEKEKLIKFLEDIKLDDSIPKNYGTLLDIMRYIRTKLTSFTEEDVTEIMQQYYKKQGAKEFADKLKEKMRDFKEWETEDGYPIHSMSETQRIYKCINFVDELLNEMGCK